MIRGERFDIDDEVIYDRIDETKQVPFVKDVIERAIYTPSRVAPPAFRNPEGFPSHKRRAGISTFKHQRLMTQTRQTGGENDQSDPAEAGLSDLSSLAASLSSEKREIDQENRKYLAKMTEEQLEAERQELVNSLPSSLLERLLRRANIDDDSVTSNDFNFADMREEESLTTKAVLAANSTPCNRSDQEDATRNTTKHVTFQDPLDITYSGRGYRTDVIAEGDPIGNLTTQEVHFPHPRPSKELDPSSESFLDDLHSKYFPTLVADPSKLAWMKDADKTGQKSTYAPDMNEIPVKAIRFSFSGQILPPRLARKIPVTKGLHHHGDAPESAGYTAPELAHLSRSAFPAQRCIAFAVLGRILYRLEKGEYGGQKDDLYQGLYKSLQEGRVLDTLLEESNRQGGHASAKAYATEALWLWRKGKEGNRAFRAE